MSVITPPFLAWSRPAFRGLCTAAALASLAACSIPLEQKGERGVEAQSPTLTHGPQRPATGPVRDADRPLPQALTYRGTLACADCENQQVTLTLLPDWTWRMRRVYHYAGGRPALTIVTTGAWQRSLDEAGRLMLRGDRYESHQFQWEGNHLRWVSQRGEAVPGAMNAVLTQQFELDPIADVLPLRGQVSPQGQGVQFTVCGMGKTYPVSMQQQGQALLDNYQRLRVAPGTPVLMWVNGRFSSEGSPPQPVLVVESLSTGTLDAPCE